MKVLTNSLNRWQGKSGFHHLLIISVTLFFILGCSEDEGESSFSLEGDSLTMEDIAGSWTATFAEFQIRNQPETSTNIIADGGSVAITIQTNGRFVSEITFPGQSPERTSGQLGFDGSLLVLLDDEDEPGDEAFLGISLSPQDVLEIAGILEFDFDQDGDFEETVIVLNLVR